MGNCSCDSPVINRHDPAYESNHLLSTNYYSSIAPSGSALRTNRDIQSTSKGRLKSVRFTLPGSLSGEDFIVPPKTGSTSDIAFEQDTNAASSSQGAASDSDMAAENEEGPPTFGELTKRQPKSAKGRKAKIQSSTTSTMMLQSTLTAPDVDQLLKCLALAIYTHLQAAENESPASLLELKESAIFDEVQNKLWTEPSLTDVRFPSVESIYKFIQAIFHVERLSHECAILCLAYIERVMRNSHVRLRPNTWRRIILGALILASKVWEDQAVWNVDFLAVFPAMTVKDLGRLEAKFLNLLKFSVGLKASTYAKYYFELRKHFMSESEFPLQPLDKEGQKRLEMRSQSEQEKHAKSHLTGSTSRSHSVDFGVSPRSPPAVLN
jgi:hypothetical protein